MVEAARALRRVFDEFPGAVSIAEVYDTPAAIARLYGPPALDGFHLVFNFQLLRRRVHGAFTSWEAPSLAAAIRDTEDALPRGADACHALGNHDVPRLASRFGLDAAEDRERLARSAALLLLGLRGPAFVYNGDELGMVDAEIPPSRAVDPMGRDPERSPMQWDRTPGRGFTTGEPWLPFGPVEIDAASQDADPHSTLATYRRAIWTRKRTPALRRGQLAALAHDERTLSFRREAPDEPPVLVALNASSSPAELAAPPDLPALLLASDPEVAFVPEASGVRLRLPPHAAAWLTTAGT